MMTLLALVKEFCGRRGLPVPNLVMAAQDDQILQIKGMLHQVLEDLNSRKMWQNVNKEFAFTSNGVEDQGVLQTLIPDFKWMVNDTFWNRTHKLPVYGPRSPQEWQALKAVPMTGPFMQYRIMGGHLLLNGNFPAGESLVFEYAGEYMILDQDGVTYKQYYTNDNDTSVIKDSILLAGLTWMWKEAKGFKYAEDFRRYESLIADQAGHDKSATVLHMDGGAGQFEPAIMVPTGNWPLP